MGYAIIFMKTEDGADPNTDTPFIEIPVEMLANYDGLTLSSTMDEFIQTWKAEIDSLEKAIRENDDL